MSDSLYTTKRGARYKGPSTSEDYNSRITENYKDLVVLYNRISGLDDDAKAAFSRLIKEYMAINDGYTDLESRIAILESVNKRIGFTSSSQVDTSRFDGTSFEVPSASRCYHDSKNGLVVLPRSSSTSKLRLTSADGSAYVPSTFSATASGVAGTLDDPSISYVQSSDPYYAVISDIGKIWERSIISSSTSSLGAAVDLYIRVPVEYSSVDKVNAITINPFPSISCDIEQVSYTTASSVNLSTNDTYLPLNHQLLYNGDTTSVGWSPPGAWSGDEIINSGPKAFYFDPINISGLKIRLRQKSYFEEGGKFLYSYGLSNIDLRYDSFNDTGKIIIRYDAPNATTISDVSDVQVDIFNIPLGEKSTVYDYRIIWETSYGSGTYTLTPVPASTRVWVELTLKKSIQEISPSVSGLTLTYT